MATAELAYTQVQVEGRVVYEVQTDPSKAPNFSGPDDRNWNAFEIIEGGARFEWRTANDHVRDIAKRYAEGTLSLEKALADENLNGWLESHGEMFTELYREDHPGAPEPTPEEWDAILIREYGVTVDNDPMCSFYYEGDDRCLRDAAYALELPEWAEVFTGDSGGVGTGYTAAYISVREDKSLRDLEKWLAERAAKAVRGRAKRRA